MPSRPVGRLLDLEYQILGTIRHQEASGEQSYGFSIARHIGDDDSTGLIGHGTLYKALSRLTTMGLLESSWDVSGQDNRPRRRLYSLTTGAYAVLAAQNHAPLPSWTPPRTAIA